MYVFSDELRKAYEALANTGKRDIINKIYHKPEGLDTIFDRLNIGIPIPKWESSEERIALEEKWEKTNLEEL